MPLAWTVTELLESDLRSTNLPTSKPYLNGGENPLTFFSIVPTPPGKGRAGGISESASQAEGYV